MPDQPRDKSALSDVALEDRLNQLKARTQEITAACGVVESTTDVILARTRALALGAAIRLAETELQLMKQDARILSGTHEVHRRIQEKEAELAGLRTRLGPALPAKKPWWQFW